MSKLDCTVTNCFYNDDKCCCKGDIMVEGEEARESGSTCCGSFVEKKTSTAKNSVSQPKKDIEVGCHACHCVHNEDCRCMADKIGIAGANACQCQETECITFACK